MRLDALANCRFNIGHATADLIFVGCMQQRIRDLPDATFVDHVDDAALQDICAAISPCTHPTRRASDCR